MSAPDTNVKRQEENHKPSLFGTKGAIVAVVAIIIALIAYNMFKPETVTQDTQGGTVATDTYAPGTNSTESGTEPAATSTAND